MNLVDYPEILSCPDIPIIDVRAPKEYAQGHIPGAISIPIFDDEERAEIGTLYKQKGHEPAVLRGLELVGPKLASFVMKSSEIAVDGKVFVYCWRGGMRSESFTWLLQTAGLDAKRIRGGYKSYRHYIREYFGRNAKILILGGYTGSGKTDFIKSLAEAGIQTVDLERIANHKGSAFGHINEDPQPTNEQFENNLFEEWHKLDLDKTILLENESSFIGRVNIPSPLFEQMSKAPILSIEVPLQHRIERLVRDYTDTSHEMLIAATEKIKRKLGGQNFNQVVEFLNNDDMASATEILLVYYDRYYQKAVVSKIEEGRLQTIELFEDSFEGNSAKLAAAVNNFRF